MHLRRPESVTTSRLAIDSGSGVHFEDSIVGGNRLERDIDVPAVAIEEDLSVYRQDGGKNETDAAKWLLSGRAFSYALRLSDEMTLISSPSSDLSAVVG